MKGQIWRTRNRREQRGRSNLGGSRLSAAMETMDQRGNSPPIYGEAKEEEEGGGGGLSPPLSPGGVGVPPGQGS